MLIIVTKYKSTMIINTVLIKPDLHCYVAVHTMRDVILDRDARNVNRYCVVTCHKRYVSTPVVIHHGYTAGVLMFKAKIKMWQLSKGLEG